MAATLDVNGAEGKSSSNTTALSFAGPNITGGLTNSALVVSVVFGNGTSTVTAPATLTRGAQTLNLIGSTDNANFPGNQVAWYGLVAPTSGTGNITGTFGSSVEWFAQGSSFQGVNQTGGTTTFANYAGNGASGPSGTLTLTQAITTANGDYTLMAGTFGSAATTVWSTPSGVVQTYKDTAGTTLAGASAAQHASTTASDSYTGNNSPADVMTIAGFRLVAAPVATQPFAQTDWPLPTPPNREPSLLSWIQAYKLLLYQGKDQLPSRQLEWQVPRAIEPYPYRSFEGFYNRNLIGKDVLPRNQLEWQVPRSPEPYPYRSWEAFYNRNLIGKDKFYDGPGNVPDFDYPLPRSAEPFPYRTWTQNLLQTTLAPSLAKPFAQYDWQVPIGAEPNWRRSWEFWFNYNLIGKDQLPVRQLDWQLPTAPPRIDQTWIINLQLSTLAPIVVTVPFRQFDWPLSQGYAPLVQAGNQPLNLNLQPSFMMLPFQWDIVEGQPFANPSSSQNLLLTTLAITPVQNPFFQIDWPLPQTPQPIDRAVAQNLLLTTLAPTVTAMPFRQLDWRLPDFFLQ